MNSSTNFQIDVDSTTNNKVINYMHKRHADHEAQSEPTP